MRTKSIYYTFIFLFIFGCKDNKKERMTKSTIIPKIENCGCGVNIDDKEILENIAALFIEKNKDYILEINNYKKHDGACERPLMVKVLGPEVRNDFKAYYIYFWDHYIPNKHLPTCLIRMDGTYVVMYFSGQTPLSRESIPGFLFEECNGYARNEDSWIVLICKDSSKFTVINTPPIPDEAIKQIQEFSCKKGQTDLNNIKVEEAIIDMKMLEEMKRHK